MKVERGRHFRALRLARGFPVQTALAEASNVKQSQISRLESGERNVSIDNVVRLADAMSVSVDVVLGRVPLDAYLDRYPARSPIVASPEFDTAPETVKRTILEKHEPTWSTAKWAQQFWAAMTLHEGKSLSSRDGTLLPAAGAAEPQKLKREVDR